MIKEGEKKKIVPLILFVLSLFLLISSKFSNVKDKLNQWKDSELFIYLFMSEWKTKSQAQQEKNKLSP